MTVEIDLRGVGKTYTGGSTDVVALTPMSLSIGKGELIVIVGPSGCGKTTLLRMIAGLIQPSDGSIVIRDQPLWNRNAKNRAAVGELGFVFQQSNLFPWRTIEQNIALPLELRGVGKQQRLARAHELMRLVGLIGFEKAYPYELSGGMAQRASIARALAHNPSILLMDEPFGALDAMTRDTMNVELQRIWMELKPTIVFVTHSISESVFLADRVVSLAARPGRIVSVTEIPFARPRTPALELGSDFQGYVGLLRSLLETRGETREVTS